MQYFVKIAKLFSILLLLALTLVIASTNMSSSIIVVANEAHTATTATTTYSSNSDPSSATITKIQSINNNPPSLPAAPPAIIHRNIRAPTAIGGPTLNDPTLKVEQMINTGLKRTTSMAFLGPNDILVLEKNTGKIHRILNGKILPQPLLDVNVANEAKRGLLGIAVAKNDNASTENGNTRHVFLYYTESGGGKDGDDAGHRGQAENNLNGIAPDGTGGILRITQDGQIADNPPLGDNIPLALYYAYGMRNTFGMDFDPITGNLWDTENGNTFGDEINLVHPGFNSGWSQVAGIWEAESKPGPAIGADTNNPPKYLVTFGGKGVYRAPELATHETIAPTAIKFLNSDKLGKQYENTIFVGDGDFGHLYNFKLNEDRTGLVLDGPLANKIANNIQDLKEGGAVLGQGFCVITDIHGGPDDGYLYILTLNGRIYRIVPSSSSS